MKNFFSRPHDINSVELVGGKGLHLQKLVQWDANVPPFFILTTESFLDYRKSHCIHDSIKNKFDIFFEDHPVVALRSSMIGEDQEDSSFAGLFETILDVSKSSWEEALKKIYSSISSPRVKEYIEQKKLNVDLKMAVVVQAQVNVEKSGVLFSRAPMPPTSAMAIDAALGMGEGVVSGYAKVDHYLLTRRGELIHQVLNEEMAVLNEKEIKTLISEGCRLEKEMGVPCDIEWGLSNNILHIFQIRPITRNFDKLECFVDTNLSESYPGTVSPFTAKFVQVSYKNVFKESAISLGAHGERLEMLTYHYARLISCLDDHLYYNLEHYYAVLRSLPGGEKNISNWHKMIGGSVDLNIPYHSTELTNLETVKTIVSLIKLGFRKSCVYTELLKNLEQFRNEIQQKMGTLSGARDTIEYLTELLDKPLGFGLTVSNDVFIMMGIGFLERSLKNKHLNENIIIDLLRTSNNLDSIQPLVLFNDIIKDISLDFLLEFEKSDLEIGFDPYLKIFDNLLLKGWKREVELIKSFLHEYGDRSFEELKIESLPLKNDPRLFFHLLKWAKDNETVEHLQPTKEVDLDLNWLEKKCLRFTRECIAMREATRLWRGKFYHIIRQLILQLVRQLQDENETWRDFSLLDFFSINHSEWNQFATGKLSTHQIQIMIRERSGWQNKKKHYPEIIQWSSREKLPDLMQIPSFEVSQKGQGVSPGILEGTALVLEHPQEAFESQIKDFILVTKNTDPAWVYIMARSKGLISEKGSMLSHTAIIGRELGIPTIVGVKGATHQFKTGDRLRIDGSTGKIEIL